MNRWQKRWFDKGLVEGGHNAARAVMALKGWYDSTNEVVVSQDDAFDAAWAGGKGG